MNNGSSQYGVSLSSPAAGSGQHDGLWIHAYCTPEDPLPIVPAPADRAWMDETQQAFANRCLPLRIANQAGWFILNVHAFDVTWDGGQEPSATRILCKSGPPLTCPSSHFGHGIITWRIPYLFRTPPGFNLLVRGPSNWFKDAIAPLDGIVEADWAVATFTMNWKITRPNVVISFDPGDPICMFMPQPRGQLEQFVPQIRDLQSEPALEIANCEWARSRTDFLRKLHDLEPETAELRWQKHYFRGTSPSGVSARDCQHQVRLRLSPFSAQLGEKHRVYSVTRHNNEEERCRMAPNAVATKFSDEHSTAVPRVAERTPISTSCMIVPDFFPSAAAMRSEFNAHFSDPYGRFGPSQQVWDYWYVPDMYTYLRTDPKRVFSPDLVDYFLEALAIWSLNNLGLGRVSHPCLSLYVNGCRQEPHNDSSNGRLAYVFSLTEWSNRRFVGGETQLFRDTPYWGSSQIVTAAAGTAFYELVPAIFNQLLVFDNRLVHAVRPIQGNMDPRDGRLVLHGHISEAGITADGALDQEQAENAIASIAPEILSDLRNLDDYHGFLTVRLDVEKTGKIEALRVLCNRILPISPSAPDPATMVSDILRRLANLRFPDSSGTTCVILPIILASAETPGAVAR